MTNSNIYEPKQSKKVVTDIDESNGEIFSVIDTLVIDIYQRTQTAKTLFFIKYSKETTIAKIYQTTFSLFVFVDIYQ